MKILLVENRPNVGFGSNIDVILRATVALNKMGVTDIYYHWENILYGDPGENLFDKYIKKQTKFSGVGAKMAHAIQFAQGLLHYDLSSEQHNLLRNWGFFETDLFKRIKIDALNAVDSGVGIHVRNPFNGHLEYPSISTCIEWANRILDNHYRRFLNNSLFIATDQDSAIGAFKYEYGKKLKYNKNVFRSPFYMEKDHGFWPDITDKSNLGYDFLLEAYALSMCKEIIYAGSNLVTFSAALSPGNYYHQIPTKSRDWDGGFENVKKLNKQKRKL
jgi:hypothetical protein